MTTFVARGNILLEAELMVCHSVLLLILEGRLWLRRIASCYDNWLLLKKVDARLVCRLRDSRVLRWIDKTATRAGEV